MRRHLLIAILAAAAGCSGSSPPSMIEQAATVPATVTSTVSATCTAGTTVRVTGELALGGLSAEIILRNNAKGTHEATEEAAASAVLVPADHTLEIPTQTASGQAVADPVLSVQLLDASGQPVGAETVLGPCAAAPFTVTSTGAIDVKVALTVTVAGCANHPGPTINVDGSVTFAGLQERVIARDGTGGAVVGSATAPLDIVALPAGQTLSVPKQPVRGGVGGNPWISARLVDADGKPLTDEVQVGRCEDLAGSGSAGD
jgi:hypothetical protein